MTSKVYVNPDLKEERNKVIFNVEEFTNWFHGGSDKVKEKRFLENYVLSDPQLQSDVDSSYLSHKEKYEEAIRRVVVVLRRLEKLQSEGHQINDLYVKVLGGLPVTNVLKEGHPLVTHMGMFIQSIDLLGNEEQKAEWYEKASRCKMLGTYVQTELGHGTFIRGLETTATYDPKTKEFVINSPSIRAYKWWPGGLGHTVNHAVVFAQLYSLGKHHGLQPFMVQIRDYETHMPMKGIIIGELGNKVGYNAVNNGFLGFNNVRIPLKNMMMKNAKVLENGEFMKTNSPILTYLVMTQTRVGIVRGMAEYLMKASTIAMRYSLVRRQSPIDPNSPEPKIIEHVTQQMKIFPSIAKVFAIKYAAENLIDLYYEVSADMKNGNLSRLPELHALSCCLKAVCTDEAARTVQICRLACGGHGYLNSSGFNDIYGNIVAAQHYEGENTIMNLQTARFLMKVWKQALNNEELTPNLQYMKNFIQNKGRRSHWDESVDGIIRAFQSATAGKVSLAYKHIEERKKFCSTEQATSQTGIELAKAAELYCQLFMLQSLANSINNGVRQVSPALGNVLKNILELYAVDLAIKSLESLLQFVDISSADIERLQNKLESALNVFKINAIGIVDGFDIPDTVLGSTLGAYDGDVYKRLLEQAKKSPLNQEDVNKSFHLYLKPFMKSNM